MNIKFNIHTYWSHFLVNLGWIGALTIRKLRSKHLQHAHTKWVYVYKLIIFFFVEFWCHKFWCACWLTCVHLEVNWQVTSSTKIRVILGNVLTCWHTILQKLIWYILNLNIFHVFWKKIKSHCRKMTLFRCMHVFNRLGCHVFSCNMGLIMKI